MGKPGFIKGVAIGAVLAALATMFLKDEHRDEKTATAMSAADSVKKRVLAHMKSVGKVTKAAFNKIVETTLAEYRGAKALTAEELAELKKELKENWGRMHDAMK